MSFILVSAGVGAGATLLAAGIKAGTSAIAAKNAGKTAQQIADEQARAQVTSSYLNLWGKEASSDAAVLQGAYGLQAANQYKNVAIIAGAVVLSSMVLVIIIWGFHRLLS